MLNGILVIDKPKDISSFKVVSKIKKILCEKKVGHAGTLDPLATGVLLVLVGKSTKALPFLREEKNYISYFKLGIITDTQDVTGRILEENKPKTTKLDCKKALCEFAGKTLQTPPMYSALKKNGKRLYKLAREGLNIFRKPRSIFVYKIKLLDFNEKSFSGKFFISCSKGTYIRTICHDLGSKLGCGATMMELRRVYSSGFSINETISLKILEKSKKAKELLLKTDTAFKFYSKAFVTELQTNRFKCGGGLKIDRVQHDVKKLENGQILRVYFKKEFLGLGKVNINKNELSVLKNF
ncbi:MAG: tRNA pseudouridine(55) synthase TruB [Oscillospiraceae bacterium]|jgi:tRNA pseudouridine55 synthase|nr:tRNA pseudouridine(55) synthase TruB [Oscillospiraceae bacterium]